MEPQGAGPREGASGSAPEGAAFHAVARTSRRPPIVIAIGAAAVIGLAFVTRTPGLAIDPRPPSPTRPPLPTAVAGPGAPKVIVAAPSAPELPARNPTVEPLATISPVAVEAGTNALIPAGQTPVRLSLSLPEGWTRFSDSSFARLTGRGSASASISAWSLKHVNVFPCRWSAGIHADEELMRSARGQATALASWWGQDPGMPASSNSAIAPLATTPEATQLAGLDAWYVEILVPRALDLDQCDGGQLVLWRTVPGEVKRSAGPGELSRLWVIDVEGESIVIDISTDADATADEATRLSEIVGSLAIESAGT